MIQYSKILPFITGIIFVGCLVAGFITDFSTVVDVSFYVTAVTVSGSIMLTTITAYLKKASVENSIKCRMTMYEQMAKTKIKYNEKMMQLQKEYQVECPIDGDMENLFNETISSADEKINSTMDEVDIVEREDANGI